MITLYHVSRIYMLQELFFGQRLRCLSLWSVSPFKRRLSNSRGNMVKRISTFRPTELADQLFLGYSPKGLFYFILSHITIRSLMLCK